MECRYFIARFWIVFYSLFVPQVVFAGAACENGKTMSDDWYSCTDYAFTKWYASATYEYLTGVEGDNIRTIPNPITKVEYLIPATKDKNGKYNYGVVACRVKCTCVFTEVNQQKECPASPKDEFGKAIKNPICPERLLPLRNRLTFAFQVPDATWVDTMLAHVRSEDEYQEQIRSFCSSVCQKSTMPKSEDNPHPPCLPLWTPAELKQNCCK